MKALSLLASALIVVVTAPLPAQVFRPETVTGAAIGGLAGAVIGHNDGRHGWEGAAYGAAAGAIIGTAVGHARDHDRVHVPRPGYRHYGHHRHYGHAWSPRGSFGFHHRHWSHGHRHDRWARPYRGWSLGWDAYPVYPRRSYAVAYPAYRGYRSYEPVTDYRPHYASRGALWGGIAGAIIGHNHGRRGWEGAAYGLGAGYLLGSWADARARREEAEQAAAEAWYRAGQATAAPTAPAAPTASAPVTIINNYYSSAPSTPMSSANSMFGR